jgi:streptogramin lyase
MRPLLSGEVTMRISPTFGMLAALFLVGPASAETPANDAPVLKEWKVEFGGRSRDPYVAPDGKVWFVGQAGNYIASFDPAQETFRRYHGFTSSYSFGASSRPLRQKWEAARLAARQAARGLLRSRQEERPAEAI